MHAAARITAEELAAKASAAAEQLSCTAGDEAGAIDAQDGAIDVADEKPSPAVVARKQLAGILAAGERLVQRTDVYIVRSKIVTNVHFLARFPLFCTLLCKQGTPGYAPQKSSRDTLARQMNNISVTAFEVQVQRA